jgi:L,D-peptidoglycan transpeptidase YkuD (ErfK/YbiS/YcfS/YnhG family)
VIVDALGGSFAGVSLRVRSAGQWQCTRDAMPARIGRNGILPLDRRVADDGTTPAGTFPLGTMTAPNGDVFQFFGNGADPGVHGGWHQVQGGDCWDATGGDAAYNTLVSRPAPQCTGDDEYLANSPGAYSRAALIGANMGPDRSGDGPGEVPRAAAIFLHRFSYDVGGATKATSGCVSLGDADLDAVLRVLVPGQAWFVVQGAG